MLKIKMGEEGSPKLKKRRSKRKRGRRRTKSAKKRGREMANSIEIDLTKTGAEKRIRSVSAASGRRYVCNCCDS